MVRYVTAIWTCRYFWLTLVKMDLRTRYRRSILGMGWSLLNPLAMTTILCIVFSKILMPGGDFRTYAPFLLTGLAAWSYIITAAMHGCQCLYQGESYIRQFPAPMAIYPLRTALGATVHFLIALVVVIGMSWVLPPDGVRNIPYLPALIPAVLLLLVLTWSLSVLTGFANVYFQDTQHLCEVGFQLLFYMTPIIYPESHLRDRNLGWLVDYNPLVAFLDLIRIPILKHEFPPMQTYLTASLTALVLATVASFVLARCQKRLVFAL